MVAAREAGERSLFSVDAPNVVMETVKPAEDGSGDLVLRLYESKRTATRCALTTSLPFRSAAQTNMLEETEAALSCDGGSIPLEFRPFEVKTLRLQAASLGFCSNKPSESLGCVSGELGKTSEV